MPRARERLPRACRQRSRYRALSDALSYQVGTCVSGVLAWRVRADVLSWRPREVAWVTAVAQCTPTGLRSIPNCLRMSSTVARPIPTSLATYLMERPDW